MTFFVVLGKNYGLKHVQDWFALFANVYYNRKSMTWLNRGVSTHFSLISIQIFCQLLLGIQISRSIMIETIRFLMSIMELLMKSIYTVIV
jgi:hypothetical protein